MAAASSTMAHDADRRASSSGISRLSAVIGAVRPSAKVMLPSTRTARRRMFRAGVLSSRWAADRANAPTAAQRRLSTPARNIRRRAVRVEGSITFADGRTVPITAGSLLTPLERALRAASWAIVLLAAAMAVARLG